MHDLSWQVFSVSMIFNGLLLQATDVIWPFRAVAYCSQIRYGLRLLMYCAFIDSKYTGSVRCDANASR
jgi:Asp-tRNA(Asn)/Glu-tRNA(Gln) amidotransferase B subunit